MGGSGISIVGEGEHTLSKGDTRLVKTMGECGKLAFVSPIDILNSSRIGDSGGDLETGVALVRWYGVEEFTPKDVRLVISASVIGTNGSLRGLGNITGKHFNASKSSSITTAQEMMTSSRIMLTLALKAAKTDVISVRTAELRWGLAVGSKGTARVGRLQAPRYLRGHLQRWNALTSKSAGLQKGLMAMTGGGTVGITTGECGSRSSPRIARFGGLQPVRMGDTKLVMTRGDRGGLSITRSPGCVAAFGVSANAQRAEGSVKPRHELEDEGDHHDAHHDRDHDCEDHGDGHDAIGPESSKLHLGAGRVNPFDGRQHARRCHLEVILAWHFCWAGRLLGCRQDRQRQRCDEAEHADEREGDRGLEVVAVPNQLAEFQVVRRGEANAADEQHEGKHRVNSLLDTGRQSIGEVENPHGPDEPQSVQHAGIVHEQHEDGRVEGDAPCGDKRHAQQTAHELRAPKREVGSCERRWGQQRDHGAEVFGRLSCGVKKRE
ncbi:hypothetical protein ON010_g9890 [Phytophthora cinnamomi]|nr:hypothetical protein ON010_g9890 [Phytophthora cinnamomi]